MVFSKSLPSISRNNDMTNCDDCRFFVQKTNKLVQLILNLQKIWSESVFWKKSCISDGNHNLPYKSLKFSVQVSMFSLIIAFSRCLAQNANILVQPVLNLQKIWSE